MIYKINIRNLVLYDLLIYYGIFVSYQQNAMLDLLTENMIFIYNKQQENIANNCVIISSDSQQFKNYSLQ